ncbi:uncharacterized protein LOC134824174 isoform X3 [Bolinopsis microptera]|uniref:uncharacterized protein LOC134824174 isoform X3 n=1 Tax=Bolinopsis microptera TaxID=2820187 RepID=UPI003078DAB9
MEDLELEEMWEDSCDVDPSVERYLASMEGGVCTPTQLIELTKLLGPGNPVLNQLYLKLVDRTICRSYETQTHLEECRQLLWLVFSHPSFTVAERASLCHWVDLFDRLFPNYHESESGYSSGGSDRSSSCSPSPTQDKMFVYNPNFMFQFPPPPPPPPALASLPPHCRRNSGVIFKRSQSEPLGGGNFVGTRCKVQHRERAIDVTSHMTALMSWLKTLRLHKYYAKLSAMNYDTMVELNELKLGDITEGARRKILLNIQKLSGRHGLLQDIMNDLSKPGRFNPCVTELHNMLMKTPFRLPPSSPLAPNPDPDYDSPTCELIYVYTTVLETAGNIILANNIEEDCQKLFFKLLEDAAQHAAFPDKQRRIVCEILQQCIDNYNYRNGQVIQLKRFDLTNFPHSVKIKYPIKPVNGVNHQSSGGYSGYNKFNRGNKPNWQQCRSNSGHLLLGHSHSAPVAPPTYSPFSNNIWSPPAGSCPSLPCSTLGLTEQSGHKPDSLDYVGLESLCSQIAECALAEK